MKTVLKNIVTRTCKPLLVRYLSRTRMYRYGSLRLEIPPQVFHPGFFFSTKLLLRYICRLPVKGKKILELGAGSGLISMDAAGKGAIVTATDINPVAIDYLRKNSRQNNRPLEIILSDLFAAIPVQTFDIIAVNPPYYKKQPQSLLDHAWFCGLKGEYFTGLFGQLHRYIHAQSQVLMILCDGCDRNMIEKAAAQNQFRLRCVQTRQNLLEKNFIYKIERQLETSIAN